MINFSFGSNVISLGQVVSYTSVNFTKDLAQVPFVGLEKDEELNINSLSAKEFITLQSTTSTRDSGFYEYLLPKFTPCILHAVMPTN